VAFGRIPLASASGLTAFHASFQDRALTEILQIPEFPAEFGEALGIALVESRGIGHKCVDNEFILR
jgi:hypothetical protein